MKQPLKKAEITAIRFAFFIALLIALFPSAARAALLPDAFDDVFVTVRDDASAFVDGQRELPADAIRWWHSDADIYYIFLPAMARPENIRLWYGGPDTLTVDEHALRSGDLAPFLLPENEYTLMAGDQAYRLQVLQSENIPVLFLTTESGGLTTLRQSKKNEETGTLLLMDADAALVYSGALSQIKGRGNSTFGADKMPFQIKLAKPTDLLGMGKAKTWILLADGWDNSLLRNRITLALADAVGLPYTSSARSVDVYVNNDYAGTYLLCEKVEIGPTRIAIHDLESATEAANDALPETYPRFARANGDGSIKGYYVPVDPPDITGGYLMEYDFRYGEEKNGFVTSRGAPVVVKEPRAASEAQLVYISAFLQGFENAVFAKDGIDPDTGKHYSQFVDVDSFVKKYLIEEIAKNNDANYSSLFLYKPADAQSTLAFAGPAWDYDLGYGNYPMEGNLPLLNPRTFFVNGIHEETYFEFFPALYAQEDFYRALVRSYWADFAPALRVLLGIERDPTGRLRSVDAYVEEIAASAAMNFLRWPMTTRLVALPETGRDYAQHVAYLKDFLAGRLAFLSSAWPEV